MFKRAISLCMAVVMFTQTAFFDAESNRTKRTYTNEATVMETTEDIITSEEAFEELDISVVDEVTEMTTEEPEETDEASTEVDEAPEEVTGAEETTEQPADEKTTASGLTEETVTEAVQETGAAEEAALEETTKAEDMQNAGTIELLETSAEQMGTEIYAASGSCTVVRTGEYSAFGTTGHTFSTVINGVTYYPLCCDSSKGSPDASGAEYNLDGLVTEDPSSMVYKTMYYGYGGPEPYSFGSTGEAVVATARNLSYYMNNDGLPGNNFFKFLQNAATPPSHTFALSSTDTTLTDVKYDNQTYQGSNWITLNMDKRLTAVLDAPSDVIILIKEDGSVKKVSGQNGISIKGGEAFRVLGDKSLNGSKKISLHYDGDKMILVYKISPAVNSSLQQLLYRGQKNPSTSLTFKFEGSGALKINKKSSNEDITNGNNCYSFEGIEYSLYADGKKQVLATFVMNKAGNGAVGEITAAGEAAGISRGGTYLLMLPLGNYDVKETKTNGHYDMDTNVYDVTVNEVYDEDNEASVAVKTYSDTPKMDPVVIALEKQNKEGNEVKGAANLEGAQYTIRYYAGDYSLNNLPAKATRTWVIQTKYDKVINSYIARLTNTCFVSGDAFYTDELGKISLPHGTITIQETKAPKGYKLDGANLYLTGASAKDNKDVEVSGNIVLTKITDKGLNLRVNSSNSVDVDSAAGINILQTEEMIRGDLSFVKKDYVTGEGMAYIPFLIRSKTTGEAHVVCTDENGKFSTAAVFMQHSDNTNANDGLLNEVLIDDIKPCGTWFYGNADAVSTEGVSDTRGALPYDTYIITELPCTANKGRQPLEPVEVTISEDGGMAAEFELVNVPNPQLKTTAWADTKNNHVAKLGTDITLNDTCEYLYLTAGETYTVHGVMVDGSGKPIMDASGRYIEASKVFTTDAAYEVSRYEKCGSIDVSYTVNATGFAGVTGTFFEYISLGDTGDISIIDKAGNITLAGLDVIAEHADVSDTSQQITFEKPEIHTMLVNKETSGKYAVMKKDVMLADKVSYTGLADGKYVVSGVLMNKQTGLPVEVNGSEVTASAEFEVKGQSDGSKEVTYHFDGTNAGLVNDDGTSCDVVCYEKLYIVDGGEQVLIAEHEDINDTDQTISFTYIRTYAENKADGSKEFKVSDKAVTITDTISYFNLEPGEYVVSGYLMDKAENKPITINGEKITVSKTFQSDASGNGTVEVDYTFATSAVMDGKSSKDIVVFEELYMADGTTLVCVHKDINDENQTVHVSDQPKTGDMVNPYVIAMLGIICIAAIILLLKRRNKHLA